MAFTLLKNLNQQPVENQRIETLVDVPNIQTEFMDSNEDGAGVWALISVLRTCFLMLFCNLQIWHWFHFAGNDSRIYRATNQYGQHWANLS